MRGTQKILSTEEESLWTELVEKTQYRDIFYLPEYIRILAGHMDATGHLYFYGNENKYIIYPFMVRKIDRRYRDIVSPWYYGGPLFYGDIGRDEVEQFLSEFGDFCRDEKIVSEFSRFNPYLENFRNMENQIDLYEIGRVVWVDLTQDLDSIFMNSFSSACRRSIRKSKKVELKIHWSNREKHLRAFHSLYVASMKAKDARGFYYFPYHFLTRLLENLRDSFILITAEYDHKIVGGNIYLYKYGTMYYYLGARDPRYPKANASNRIMFEGIKYGREHGLKIFDIGGGPVDSGLLRFKKKFSNRTKTLYGHKRIHQRQTYRDLCSEAGKNPESLQYEQASFFPEYR